YGRSLCDRCREPCREWREVMACTGASPNWSSTWGDLQDWHDNHATHGDTITVIAGDYSSSSQLLITKAISIVPGGAVSITDNLCAGSCFSGTSDSFILIQTSNSGNTQFGQMTLPRDPTRAGWRCFHFVAGTTIQGNPSAIGYVQGTGTGTALVLGHTLTSFYQNYSHIQDTNAVIEGHPI